MGIYLTSSALIIASSRQRAHFQRLLYLPTGAVGKRDSLFDLRGHVCWLPVVRGELLHKEDSCQVIGTFVFSFEEKAHHMLLFVSMELAVENLGKVCAAP
jgi:hypothetical protein